MSIRHLVVFALVGLSGCSCQPKPADVDAGTEVDAGVDAGVSGIDSGATDAAEPDAGPPPELKILKVLPPRSGLGGGVPVMLQGSGFLRDFAGTGSVAKGVTTLKVGGNQVIDYQIIDDQSLEFRAPPGKLGPATVSIQNPNGFYHCLGCFTYFEELVLSSVAPTSGALAGGNVVTLSGQGFSSDVEVLFGTFSSPKVDFESSKELKVTVPSGLVADAVDVTVYNKNGVGNLRRGYRYVANVRITAVAPPFGPLDGGTSVVLTGQGFENVTGVTFGISPAAAFTVDSPTQVTAVSPAGTSLGAVDIKVDTALGTWKVRGGFSYVDASGAFAAYAVVPHVSTPGSVVTLMGQGLDAVGLTVTLGGTPVVLGARTFSTAEFTVPVRGSLPRKVDVVVGDGVASATMLQAFTYRLSLASVSPASGPATGGTAVQVAGAALPSAAEAFLGALLAPSGGSSTETQLLLTTPKGQAGAKAPLWVREVSDFENEDTLPAAFTFDQTLSVGRVQPDRGAIAGGTLVTVLGSGFGDGVIVSFGASKGKDVKIIDSHTLSCRTPKGALGTVDVMVERAGVRDTLSGGFSYFDPRSISGGLSGGPLVGTLNVSVLDATQGFYGQPVPLAQVMLGVDPATPFQGLTDARGQLTFSDPALVKAQTVTVFKDGYSSATVTQVNAENLTVFISRTGGPSEPSPSGPPPPPQPVAIITGRITGFKAPRLLGPMETLEARVFVAQNSLYAGPPFGGAPSRNGETWVIKDEKTEFYVAATPGLHAVYAVLGIVTSGGFVPVSMGVRRGISAPGDAITDKQDIILDMHLDVNVNVTIDGALTAPGPFGMPSPTVNSVYAWLDLGAEGFIPMTDNWNTGTAGSSTVTGATPNLVFPRFPRLDGSNFVFLNQTGGPSAVSYYFRRQPGDLNQGVTIGPLLPMPSFTAPSGTFNGIISWNVPPGPRADIHEVRVQKPTLFGPLTVWSVVLPGADTQVVLPPAAVQKLKTEEAGNSLYVLIYSSRSPKFAYNQWTYGTLSAVSWSSFTIAQSATFRP